MTRPLHEPTMLRVADPRSGPRLCEAQRFMDPMRDFRVVEATFGTPNPSRRRGGNGAARGVAGQLDVLCRAGVNHDRAAADVADDHARNVVQGTPDRNRLRLGSGRRQLQLDDQDARVVNLVGDARRVDRRVRADGGYRIGVSSGRGGQWTGRSGIRHGHARERRQSFISPLKPAGKKVY